MALTVAQLVLDAQNDASLKHALLEQPEVVSQERNLPAIVIAAAARALRKEDSAPTGFWY